VANGTASVVGWRSPTSVGLITAVLVVAVGEVGDANSAALAGIGAASSVVGSYMSRTRHRKQWVGGNGAGGNFWALTARLTV
jgi:hypothetical protein